jgi:hypothetical protein
MASDITSTSDFSEGNMKPVSGEIIDAVWGQKIAENTGWLRYRKEQFVGNISGQHIQAVPIGYFNNDTYTNAARMILTKNANHDQITGTFYSSYISVDAATEGTFKASIDGTEVLADEYGGVTNGTNYSSFTWDASYKSTGDNFQVRLDLITDSSESNVKNFHSLLSAWSSI